MRVVVAPDYEALTLVAAKFIAEAIAEKPGLVLALPTGNTPLGVYRRLVMMNRHGEVSFSRVTTFNLDEYIGLGTQHPLSFRVYMKEHFFGLVDIDPARVHLPDGLALDPEAEGRRYEAEIAKAGGLDLAVLGIGLNGHIGFNEPGSSFDSRTRPVTLSRETMIGLQAGRPPEGTSNGQGSARVFPMSGLTVGIATIMEAKRLLLLASGEVKAAAVTRALDGPISKDFPASVLQRHANVTVLVDREAAIDLD
ncbi:MAG TPA: glucosamine-6-phosphate deaminase [Bacillota bacterium]|jgi:glucosamine-6-phosphate deaminase